MKLPDSVKLGEGELSFTNPSKAETQETRAIEVELIVADNANDGEVIVPSHAVYYVCTKMGGKCFYLRQDFPIKFTVNRNATTIR